MLQKNITNFQFALEQSMENHYVEMPLKFLVVFICLIGFVFFSPEPAVQVSHDLAIADSGQQSVFAGL